MIRCRLSSSTFHPQVLKDERDPEVRRMNEWILQAKCHAIRDQQMAEKERRL